MGTDRDERLLNVFARMRQARQEAAVADAAVESAQGALTEAWSRRERARAAELGLNAEFFKLVEEGHDDGQ